MGPVQLNKRGIFVLLAAVAALFVVWSGLTISPDDVREGLANIPLPGSPKPTYGPVRDPDTSWDFPHPDKHDPPAPVVPPTATSAARYDDHPITHLMEQADLALRLYEGSASTTFKQTLEKYRSKYGRHPPPGFKEWYKFARKRNVVNIDDFEHIMDDLRPFWAIEPAVLRNYAAHMWEDEGHGASGIHIRNHKVVRVNFPMWRSEIMEQVMDKFIKHIPDMDIAMNRLDQPRVVVPYEDLQILLQNETDSRMMPPETMDSFTTGLPDLLDVEIQNKEDDKSERLDAGWFNYAGKQYMDVAAKGCPPDSPARSDATEQEANALYKEPMVGLVNNFNLSSDLCTVGPAIKDQHGMLFSSSSMLPSHKLIPIFGECKVNINNDIMFPANMYYKHDDRYDYDPAEDVDWRQKKDDILWRGVTSGGVQLEDNWQKMHRQRLVQMWNGTWTGLEAKEANVLMQKLGSEQENITYEAYEKFSPSKFADAHSDIGFVQAWGCIPGNCSFYDDVFAMKEQTTLTSQFKSRYLIDVDGHSFSGRWHAFLQSKSLGLKATIFREWHDSRLFAWRHFIPIDNRYDDLYAVMTYFIGYGSPNAEHAAEVQDPNPQVYIAPHAMEAQKIARQSREWANRVLRREDIEVYMFRLLLEYGRIIDDNRDRIGYSGDGSELDAFDNGQAAAGWGIPDIGFGKLFGGGKKSGASDDEDQRPKRG